MNKESSNEEIIKLDLIKKYSDKLRKLGVSEKAILESKQHALMEVRNLNAELTGFKEPISSNLTIDLTLTLEELEYIEYSISNHAYCLKPFLKEENPDLVMKAIDKARAKTHAALHINTYTVPDNEDLDEYFIKLEIKRLKTVLTLKESCFVFFKKNNLELKNVPEELQEQFRKYKKYKDQNSQNNLNWFRNRFKK